jgi:hypothetical protein
MAEHKQDRIRDKVRLYPILTTKTLIWTGVVILILLLIPPSYVCLRYWNMLVFDPSEFMTDYIKFLGGLLSLLFGFVLVNVYWERRLESDRAYRLRRLLLLHLDLISRLCWETGHTLDRHVVTREESIQRDHEVFSNKNRLADAGATVASLFDAIASTRDEQLIEEASILVRDVVPLLEALGKLPDVHPGSEELRNGLSSAGTQVFDSLQRLRGVKP